MQTRAFAIGGELCYAIAMATRGQAALVTGAGQRIGRAIALRLAADGWAVGVHYHQSRTAAEKLVREIVAQGGRAAAFKGDLASPRTPPLVVRQAAKDLGTLRLLVNNAALFEPDDIQRITPARLERTLAVNLAAPLFLAQAFAQQAAKAKSANIINLLDQRVWNLAPDFLSYTLAKSGLWTLTRILAQALAPTIRVNGIGPGPVLPSARQSAVHFERSAKATPLRRGAEPSEIADAVMFLLAAPAMTGQMLALDGGQHFQRGAQAE